MNRYIGFCVYNVVVMCMVGVSVSLALTDNETITYAFQAFCILFCTTTILCLLFIPKVRLSWRLYILEVVHVGPYMYMQIYMLVPLFTTRVGM